MHLNFICFDSILFAVSSALVAPPAGRFPPNAISYNAAISACEQGKQREEALRLPQQNPHIPQPRDVVGVCPAAECWPVEARNRREL